jgi:hypothetical protein
MVLSSFGFNFRHSGMRLLAQTRNPASHDAVWIPGSALRAAPE